MSIKNTNRRTSTRPATGNLFICILILAASLSTEAQEKEPKTKPKKNIASAKKELTKKWIQHTVVDGRFRITAPGNYSSARKTHFKSVDGTSDWLEYVFASTNPVYIYTVRYQDLKCDVGNPPSLLAQQMELAVNSVAEARIEHREDSAIRTIAEISTPNNVKLRLAYHLEGNRLYEVAVRVTNPDATFEEEALQRFINSLKPIKLPKSKGSGNSKSPKSKGSTPKDNDPQA